VVGAQAAGMRAAHYTGGFRRASADADLLIHDLGTLAEEVFRIAPGEAGG
jgi:hypothetical protein